MTDVSLGWVSRRAFLKSATMGMAVASRGAAAATRRTDCRTWKVGTSFPLSSKTSPDDFIALKRAGLEVVELGLGSVDRALATQAREWADAAGIALWSAHVPYARNLDPSNPSEPEREEVVRRLSEMFDVYAVLGLRTLNIHASWEISKPIPSDERQARIASARRSLAALTDKAASIRAQLVVECLPRACLGNTSAEMMGLLDGLTSTGVTLDTNHVFQERPEEFIRTVGARIVNTHVADNDGIDERHWLPGQGVVEFVPLVRALEDVGYPGPFTFECAGTAEEKIAVWTELKRLVPREQS
jgi:sugar phosphate isomerase/epimerase